MLALAQSRKVVSSSLARGSQDRVRSLFLGMRVLSYKETRDSAPAYRQDCPGFR